MGSQPHFAKHSSQTEELLHIEEPKVLGTIDPKTITDPVPKTASWTSADGTQFDVTDIPPPPWITNPKPGLNRTDARNFVDCPSDVELRWLNPRDVQHNGMRNWQAVPASGDKRFKLLNPSMKHADNTVRKGEQFLAWMYKAWADDLRLRKAEVAAKRARSSRERFEATKEAFQRGAFGRYVKITDSSFPSDTIADGRSMDRS